MSRMYHAHQYDHAFIPHRLANWELPDRNGDRPVLLSARTGCTKFIADDAGHLMRAKKPAAFVEELPQYALSSARWPQVNPSYKTGSKATLGYKGIPTAYLPRNTVPLKAVEIPGCREEHFQ